MLLHLQATQFFTEEMLQQWQVVGNTVPDLTGPRFEPKTSHSKDELTSINWAVSYQVHLHFSVSLRLIVENVMFVE